MSDAIHDATDTLALFQPKAVELTERQTIDALKAGIRANAVTLTEEDALTLADAEMAITDADDYTRGFDVLGQLNGVLEHVKTGWDIFRKPLNELTAVVRELEAPQVKQVETLKKALGERLTTWKREFDAAQALERLRLQQEADERARAAAATAAAELEAVAATMDDPQLADALRMEAEATREMPMQAAPVQVAETPKTAGHTRENWKARIDNIDTLLRAHVAGKCHLPLEELTKALQPWMDKQAKQHRARLSLVFPGVSSYDDPIPVAPRRR